MPEEAESFDRTEQVADLLGDITSIFGNTIPDAESEPEDVRDEQIQESVLDLLGGARGSVDSDMSQEDLLAGAEDGFTFGGESSVPQDELTEEEKQEAIDYLTDQLDFGSDAPLYGEESEEEVLSGSETPELSGSSGGGSSGGGAGIAKATPFMTRLNYQVPEIPSLVQGSSPVSLFSLQPVTPTKKSKSKSMIETLFEGYI